MAAIKKVEGRIVSEKLAVFTFNDEISEPDFRRYFINKWETLTLQMENSTILFIGGIHGDKFGNLGPNENIISLTNQVMNFSSCFTKDSRLRLLIN